MTNGKKRLLAWGLSLAGYTAYSAITGRGVFNRLKFKEQHEVIARYVEGHYPGAVYSPVQTTEHGYAVMIMRKKGAPIMLHATPTPDGHYVFKEAAALK